MIQIYSQFDQSQQWLERFRGCPPVFCCVLGFTETGLIPGISAAGATPDDRQFTAIADAEFLYHGPQTHPKYPLPPLQAGASPTLITRACLTGQNIPFHLLNAGLPHPPSVPTLDLQGKPARCLSQGNALDLELVEHLLAQGLHWGETLASQNPAGYLIIGECVVGGTTTALAVLTGLGWDALGKVNSSHPACNHLQKWQVVEQGLAAAGLISNPLSNLSSPNYLNQTDLNQDNLSPNHFSQKDEIQNPGIQNGGIQNNGLKVVAAVGDPMQIVVAGMAIAASRTCGVLLAGGTQMLAVHALIQSIAQTESLPWQPHQVIIGTTRWVAEDPTGNTVGLAQLLQAPLIATQLNLSTSRYTSLQAYEQGYVKEGVGAGGSAIATYLYQGWNQDQCLAAIEQLAAAHERTGERRKAKGGV